MKPTVVFVDDDPNIREAVKRIQRYRPYRIVALESAQQCVEILAVTDIHVLVTDLEMPGFDGRTLINYFKDNRPEVVRIVLSGKLDLETTLDLVNRGEVFRCLEKPCPAFVLTTAIQDGLKLWTKRFIPFEPRTAPTSEASLLSDAEQESPNAYVPEALEEVERLDSALQNQCNRETPAPRK